MTPATAGAARDLRRGRAGRSVRGPARPVRVLGGLVALTLAATCVSLAVGAADAVGPLETAGVLLGGGDELARAIVLEVRLPRVVLGLLAGGALAVSGAVFQALLRNPLAEPYILGVSGGAAAGSVTMIVLGLGAMWGGVTAGALAGAVLAIVLVLRIALAAGPGLDTRVLLLAGVISGAFFGALIMLLLTLSGEESFRTAVFWMLGSLGSSGLGESGALALFLLPCLLVMGALARPLNLMGAGEEGAAYLGVPVERVKHAGYLTASLAAAGVVALAGIIGFVGLIVPHAVRMLWGGDHRLLLPASLLGGGVFLVLADTAARSVVPAQELPVGVVTALIGVPLFAVLLVRSAR